VPVKEFGQRGNDMAFKPSRSRGKAGGSSGRKLDPPVGDPARCAWARDDELLALYHDKEWGKPVRGDTGHLDRIAMEIFQCGLSWKIVLVKRPALREAFEGFDVQRVAKMGARDVTKMLGNAAIIRNRRKIEGVIHNARVMIDMAAEHGSYVKWFGRQDVSTADGLDELYRFYRKHFKFMGPETIKCYLWGVGKVAVPHEPLCWVSHAAANA